MSHPGRLTLPPIRAVLPGGTVQGELVRRWQTEAGEWIYVVALKAWGSRTATKSSTSPPNRADGPRTGTVTPGGRTLLLLLTSTG